MALLCFVLDLCSLSPSSLADLKQCLLQLANYFAISSSRRRKVECDGDRIGLCYVFNDRSSSSVEIEGEFEQFRVGYNPRGDFSLRDFHYAVNSLPNDSFLPEIGDSDALCCCVDMKLSSILNDQMLYSWGGGDIKRKMIVLSSYFPKTIEGAEKKLLTDAACRGVSVEFALIEQSSSNLSYMMANNSSFMRSLSDLHNCSFKSYFPGGRMFHGLTKCWLQDLRMGMEEPLHARFNFRENLVANLNQLLCCLSSCTNPIVDDFSSCETCRCHGTQLHQVAKERVETLSCPVTANILGASDVIENSVRVGEKTILYLPSSQSPMKPQHVSLPVEFNIIERTNLSSLSEGVIIGSPYIVTPADYHKIAISSDEKDQLELNAQAFRGVCHALHSMDQGLICSSNCNLETMTGAAFNCFYILQPSQDGPMLLRRLLGSEEVLPLPELHQMANPSASKDIQSSIEAVLLKMESSDYNPLLHERGFHQKLNWLVNESIQFGSLPHRAGTPPPQLKSIDQGKADSSEVVEFSDVELEAIIMEEENMRMSVETGREDKKSSPSISEEWEQLVVLEVPKIHSPTCSISTRTSKETAGGSMKQLDAKTWRILERLEAPRQLKAKAVSPTPTFTGMTWSSSSSSSLGMKRPLLLPFQPTQAAADQPSSSTQLMKPNFQRPKRKLLR